MPSINDRGRAEAVRGAVKSQYRDASIIGGISKAHSALAKQPVTGAVCGFRNWYIFHNVNADGNTAATTTSDPQA
jgi:hypothetical protein